MTQYLPGPYELELFYTEGGLTHKQRLNLELAVEGAVGDPFTSFSTLTRGGAVVAMDVATLAWVNLIKTQFAGTTNFTIANLYKFVPGTTEKNFLATFDVNLVGTGAGSYVPSQQLFLTFTTQLGNGVKVVFLEGQTAFNVRVPLRDANASIQAIANWIVSTSNWILARDESYPVGKLNLVGGQNEAIFKRRNR